MNSLSCEITLSKIIKDKSNSNAANIFGFIAYTNAHPNVIKILRDSDYWTCFDEISNGWIIYSIRPEQGSTRLPEMPEGVMGMMAPIWHEPNKNKEFLEFFDMESTQGLPLFIAFAIGQDQTIDKIAFKIDDSSQDTAYQSIKLIIDTITNTLDLIDPMYKSTTSVFREVEKQIGCLEFKQKIHATRKTLEFFTGLITNFLC